MPGLSAYNDRIVLIAGSANPGLAQAISRCLSVPLASVHIGRFPDGEIDIKVHDDIRGADIFVLQPTCPPVNDNWIELLLLLDCLRRASAGRITAVMPYYGYARKDRKDEGRVPISAKVLANTLVAGGVDRLLTLDMHAPQIQGFFDIPVDHLYAKPVLLKALYALGVEDPVVVSPDVGGIKMARSYAKALGADLAIVDKRRLSGSEIVVEHVIGAVAGRNVIIVDDMLSTGGSIAEASRIVRGEGAQKIYIAVSHGVFCGPAKERLDAAPLDKILVTDTIPLKPSNAPKKVEIVSVAGLFAQAIYNIHYCKSVSSLFDSVPEEKRLIAEELESDSSKG
jgi:ribose-phosphate pyrophosphokinase